MNSNCTRLAAAWVCVTAAGLGLQARGMTAEVQIHHTPSSLGEILGSVREQSGIEVYVDAEFLSTELHFTVGSYEAGEVIRMAALAAGLQQRTVGPLIHLAPTEEGLAVLTALPPMDEHLARQRSLLAEAEGTVGSLVDTFDFEASRVPFKAHDFRNSPVVEFGSLSEVQQGFLRMQLASRPDALLEAGTAIQLVPAFQIVLADCAPMVVPTKPNGWPGTEAEWAARFKGRYSGGRMKILLIW